MVKAFKIVAIILFLAVTQFAFGQTNQEIALTKGKEAIKLMDGGKVEESIKLLEEAQQLDPDRFDYPYELAYAHYLKQDYKEVISILEKNTNHKDVSDLLFQLLGNSYDVLGESDKAIAVYDAGLKDFPIRGQFT